MGKGDLKTKRGKIHRGTYGARRPRKTQNIKAKLAKDEEKKSKHN